MLIGVVLGIGAGVGFAALREFSDDAVRGTDKLEAETKFPVLAGIPTILSPGDVSHLRRKRIVIAVGVIASIVAAVLIFHFLVMDLDVLWARIMRKVDF
jgi:capsular polysaccharide biosynthesis protein